MTDPITCGGCGKYTLGTIRMCPACGWRPDDATVPDGGVTDPDFERAYADTYPGYVPGYVAKRTVYSGGRWAHPCDDGYTHQVRVGHACGRCGGTELEMLRARVSQLEAALDEIERTEPVIGGQP